MRLPFTDREEAGRVLADAVCRELPETELVLALPRGRRAVGFEVALALNVPLDVFVVRKLGVPGHEELAMGALASGGTRVMNAEVLETLRVGETAVERVVSGESREPSAGSVLSRRSWTGGRRRSQRAAGGRRPGDGGRA